MKISNILAPLLLTMAACGGASAPEETAPAPAEPTVAARPAASAPGDIVDVAASDPQFSTLVTAIKAAGLVETLKGPGPFTVFAPTDAAFAKLPAGTVDSLLADKAALTKVLTYHVVAGRVDAAAAAQLTSATTVQGGGLAIDATNGVTINGATVVAADVPASNGVIHVIDAVLLPE
jgi:uncharacterized surface protein with fasciclin (FAS1) repeats